MEYFCLTNQFMVRIVLQGGAICGFLPSQRPFRARFLTFLFNSLMKTAEIHTPKGVMKVEFYEQDAPNTVKNFTDLAQKGFYDGTSFHRVIDNFMIQGGDANSKDDDPSNDGLGRANDPTIPAELEPGHPHVYGAVAAARMGGPRGTPSSSSQFYLVENHDGTHFLDGQYTVFGQVIQGLEVIDKIAKLPKDERDHPVAKAKMTMKVEKLKRKKISKLYGYTFNN